LDKITIIVVCYNENTSSIAYTIESALVQTFQNKEIIIIDGGSKAETLDYLYTYVSKGVKVFSKRDEGIYHAMNRGIDAATGQWLIFMNIRDRFHDADVLSRVAEYFERKIHGDIIYGYVKTQQNKISKVKQLNKASLYSRLVCHQAMFFSAKSFQIVGRFDQSYRLQSYMDWLHRAVDKNLKMQYIPLLVCDWEDGKGASSDYKLVEDERNIVRRKYYSGFQISLLSLIDLAERAWKRIVSFNFSVPISVSKQARTKK
jgi:glycosyltransferase involved in cell wall biosynthesis